MNNFSVWAPVAIRVELELDGRRIPMDGGDFGWWSVDAECQVGSRYGFVLDGGLVLPDPRSPSQPDGVHGLSEVVDHSAFAWTDQGWRAAPLASGVLYELHIGTFSAEGTFAGAIAHLDHLVELGVTAVEVLPVAEAPGNRGWGYDGVDLFAPHSAYGGPDGFKAFVDACHARDLAVILDVVYNHVGPDGNYLAKFGPYFSGKYSTPWGLAVNYDNPNSDEVRRFVIDNAMMWLRDFHVDGLRLDAVHAIFDQSATHVLAAMAEEVELLSAVERRPLFLIAESDLNDPRVVRPSALGGWGLHAQWLDDFHHALHQALTGETAGYYQDFDGLTALAESCARTFVYVGQYAHSRERSHGTHAGDLSGAHFVTYLQNHDQIGNRAAGDRIAHTAGVSRARIGAAILAFSPFVPMLFQGEEWAASAPFQYFTDHEPDLGRKVSEGRRNEFGHGWHHDDIPDPQEEATFSRSQLDWDEIGQGEHATTLEWYRALYRLRHTEADLHDGGADLEVWVDGEVFSLRRGALRLSANLGLEPVALDGEDGDLVLASTGVVLDGALTLPPDGVAIVREG